MLICAAWLLLLCGCEPQKAAHSDPTATPMLGAKKFRAEEFFSGTPLAIARAIDAGDMALVRKLAPGVNLAAPGRRDMTLMWFAMGRLNYPAVQTLVALGVDPDTQIAQGVGTALAYTMMPRNDPNDQTGIRLLRAMLDGGLSPSYETPSHDPLLQRAAGPWGTMAAVQLLVERGTDVNARDSIGGTALSGSITAMNPEIALYLVNHGADFNTNTTNGVSVGWAVHKELGRQAPGPMRTRFEELRDLMIAKGAKWPPDPPEVVRDHMRAQGLKPAVPPGHAR